MITIKMSTSGVVHALPDNIIPYNYIIRIILCQTWIEGAKVMTSISITSMRMSKLQYTTVQNQGHTSPIHCCMCPMQVGMLWGTWLPLQSLVQVAMIAIRRVHCGTIEGERGVLNTSLQCTDPEDSTVCCLLQLIISKRLHTPTYLHIYVWEQCIKTL